MEDLFSHVNPETQFNPAAGLNTDDPLPNAGEQTWSPSQEPLPEGFQASQKAAADKKGSEGPSGWHTAGMVAGDVLGRGIPLAVTGAMDTGIGAANAAGYLKNKAQDAIIGVSPEQWQAAPYLTEPSQKFLDKYLPQPQSDFEQMLHGPAMAVGAAVPYALNAGKNLGKAAVTEVAAALGGVGSEIGQKAGDWTGSALQQVLPEGQTIFGYTPQEAGQFVGSTLGGVGGGATVPHSLPKSNKEAVAGLMDKNVPVSVGQVMGGVPGAVESLASRTNLLAMPSRALGSRQDTAIDQFLHGAGGHMTDAEAGVHAQNTAADAMQAIKDARSAIYKPYMDQIGDPQFYKNGKPQIGPDGQPLIKYPTLQPTSSIKLAKGLATKFQGNAAARKAAGIDHIDEVVDMLKKPMDINEAKQQIGYLRDKAQDLSNPMLAGSNRQLGSQLTRITKALQSDIAESAEVAKPGSKTLLLEADKKAAPTYDEEYSLKPIVQAPKDEAAAVRFLQATGSGKAVANSQMVSSLYKYADPKMADKLSAYLVKKLGQSDTHPNNITQTPGLDSSLSSSGVNNIKAKNPALHSLLFPNDPAKQINSQFIQELNTIGKTPLNQGLPHMGAIGAGGVGAGLVGVGHHLMENGLSGLPSSEATLTALAVGGATNAGSKLSTLQPLAKAANALPRADQNLHDVSKYVGGIASIGQNATHQLTPNVTYTPPFNPETFDPSTDPLFSHIVPQGAQ